MRNSVGFSTDLSTFLVIWVRNIILGQIGSKFHHLSTTLTVNYNFSSELGLRSILFDEIVTADPISANHRAVIPYAEFGVTFEYLGFEWYLKDRFSMPTIKSDDSLYGVLSAGISFRL